MINEMIQNITIESITKDLKDLNKDTKRKKLIYLGKLIKEQVVFISDLEESKKTQKTGVFMLFGQWYSINAISIEYKNLETFKQYLLLLKSDLLDNTDILIDSVETIENSINQKVLYFSTDNNTVFAFYGGFYADTTFFGTEDFYRGSDYEYQLKNKSFKMLFEHE